MCKVLINEELKGIELFFEGKPNQEVRTELKTNGFRWNGKKLCWYAKQSEDTIQLGEKLQGEKLEVAPVTAVKNNNIDLWNLTQYTAQEIAKNYNTKEIAKEIRTHLKNRFKFIKFSVTSPRGSSIYISVKSAPFTKDSEYMNSVVSYCKNLSDNYNFCTSYDPYGDYGSSYNFYSYVTIDYDFIEIEATEAIKEAIKQYDIKKLEAEKIQREKEEKEYQERLLEREVQEKQYQIRADQEKKNNEYIKNNVDVVEISEDQQYYILNSKFANLNKNNSIEEYKEEIKKNDYELNNVKITRELHFKDLKSLELYNNSLLTDFDFIEGTGGSFTEDARINTMEDYNQMTREDQKDVEWLLSGIAVYLNNELQYIIDAQGYSYARYIGLVDEKTSTTKEYTFKQVINEEELQELKTEAKEITEVYNSVVEKNSLQDWYDTRKDIVKAIKENVLLELNQNVIQQIEDNEIKNNMYKVFKEVDTLQDQFNEVDFVVGEKLTIIRSAMIAGASVSHVTFKDYEETGNSKNIKMTIGIKGKKGLYTTNIDDEVIIYRGHIEGLEGVLYELTDGGKVTKYGSYDLKAFDDILTALQEKNISPIINIFKPVF